MSATATVPFIGAAKIEELADAQRKSAGQLAPPIDPAVVALANGLVAYSASFGEDSTISGVLRRGGDGYQILVNSKHPRVRQRYTIAHELGHFLLHTNQEFVDPDINFYRLGEEKEGMSHDRRMEIQANKFAAALLMPEEFVRREYEKNKSVWSLARIFQVSTSAMGYRLVSLNQ